MTDWRISGIDRGKSMILSSGAFLALSILHHCGQEAVDNGAQSEISISKELQLPAVRSGTLCFIQADANGTVFFQESPSDRLSVCKNGTRRQLALPEDVMVLSAIDGDRDGIVATTRGGMLMLWAENGAASRTSIQTELRSPSLLRAGEEGWWLVGRRCVLLIHDGLQYEVLRLLEDHNYIWASAANLADGTLAILRSEGTVEVYDRVGKLLGSHASPPEVQRSRGICNRFPEIVLMAEEQAWVINVKSREQRNIPLPDLALRDRPIWRPRFVDSFDQLYLCDMHSGRVFICQWMSETLSPGKGAAVPLHLQGEETALARILARISNQ
jgi:hypothetical protein